MTDEGERASGGGAEARVMDKLSRAAGVVTGTLGDTNTVDMWREGRGESGPILRGVAGALAGATMDLISPVALTYLRTENRRQGDAQVDTFDRDVRVGFSLGVDQTLNTLTILCLQSAASFPEEHGGRYFQAGAIGAKALQYGIALGPNVIDRVRDLRNPPTSTSS